MRECSQRLFRLNNAIIAYQVQHKEFPPDLASGAQPVAREHDAPDQPADWPELIHRFLISPADGDVDVPKDAGAEWIAEHSSYEYIGRPGLSWKDFPEWGPVAIAHLKFDRWHAIEPTPAIPDGRMSTVAYLDGHVDLMSHVQAQRVVAESKQIWEALATGGPLPDRHQAVADLGMVIKAVRAYSEAHAGALPPDLGATLKYVPEHAKRGATLKQRASAFLSPRARRNTFVPDEPTADWVNRNASWVYLGEAGLVMPRIADPQRTVLVHARFGDAIPMIGPDGAETRVIPIANALGGASPEAEEYARWIVGESRKVIDAALGRGPLPDFQHAVHDVTILSEAIKRYAAANNGALPPDLAATWEYLPTELLLSSTAAGRANVYLSPRAERITRAPEQPGAEWIRRAASYVYLPGPGLTLSAIRERELNHLVVVHAPLDETFDIWVPDARIAAVPYADENGWIAVTDGRRVAERIAESRKKFDAARAPAPAR